MTDLLTAALAWYDAGYCVIPAHEDGSKRPFGPWKQYQHERPTRQQVTDWISSGTYTGIGIICGQASGNVEMIELEHRAVIVGSIEFLGDQARHAGISHIWETVLQGCAEQSGGGGLHMFIRIDNQPVQGNQRLAANRDNEVIAETRGEGGFVIVAPTPPRQGHHNHYQFLPGSHPDRTPVFNSDELAELHTLIRTLDDTPQQPATPPPAPPRIASTGITPGDDWNTRANWADILTPHGWTQLNSSTRNGHPITWWRRPGKTEGISASTGGESDWLYVFSTSTDLPANEPLSKFHVHAHYNHAGNHSAAARQLAADGYGTPLTPLHELAPWEIPDTHPDTQQPPDTDDATTWAAQHFTALNWHDIWADQTEEDWIIWPLLPARRLIALYSAPKVGKSLLMLELAAAAATGTPVLNNTPTPRHILYVDFENDPVGDIRSRLQAMHYQPEQLDNLHYLSFPTLSALDSDRGGKELLAAVHHYQAEAVFIDTVSRAVKGEENENDTWLNFYRHTGLRLKQAQVALMRLDHSGKDESKGQRGGSAKVGDVDAVWKLRRIRSDNGENYLLECEAHRFQLPEKSDRIMLERSINPLRHIIKGDAADAHRDRVTWYAGLLDKMEAPTDISRTDALAELKAAGYSGFSKHIWADIRTHRASSLQPFRPSAVPPENRHGTENLAVDIAGPGGTGSLEIA